LTKGFVVLILGNSESNHLGAQGTLKMKGNENQITTEMMVTPDEIDSWMDR